MKFWLYVRVLFLPILLPLSFLYGVVAFFLRFLTRIQAVSLNFPVISVGNFIVGGSGKTPVILELISLLEKKGFLPVVISKSYGVSLKAPREVQIKDLASSVGDEPLLIKTKHSSVRVFSGPDKLETALFAVKEISDGSRCVFLIDDGAQHHKIKKDISIHIWDISRSFLDLFPFPFGMSREFWFLGDAPNLTILNREGSVFSKKIYRALLGKSKSIEASYEVKEILHSRTGEALKEDFVLISGIGNFTQLKKSVAKFCNSLDFKIISELKGRDHDTFEWFTPDKNTVYVCTEKDYIKLKNKDSDLFFIVKSEFSNSFKKDLKEFIDQIEKELIS